MSYEWLVNKSGKSLPIYDAPWFETNKKKIGTLLNREVFICASGSEHNPEFKFRNSAGNLIHGYGDDSAAWMNDNVYRSVWEYPYSGSGNNKTMILRKARKIYRPDGSLFMTLAQGKKIKMKTTGTRNLAGETHPEYMVIGEYENSSGGWSTIDGSYGFIDMGIKDVGSGYAYIPVYGSW